ncbi:sensor histidine kinase [Brachybacterium sp. EF45031]|uniref:sensor histidine kinase n=1 Tax=Brachybacterium sillae TaxID=2810536 RepID=UPI00217DAB50|nr:sensor histidine kinase [Brachybacterium sillae]MCS6710994.1 sensor histidine kinase [Brachybacterium sillae]
MLTASMLIAGMPGWVLVTVLMLLAGIGLRWRTGWATLVIGALAVGHVLAALPLVPGDVMVFYALYCATAFGSERTATLSLLAAALGAGLQAAVWVSMDPAFGWLGRAAGWVALTVVGLILVGGVWAVGRFHRVRAEQIRLTRLAADQAIREREQRTALAVAQERTRITREMHDIVAHSLSVIIAQADGGRYVAEHSPETAVQALGTIGETGRSALADMRRLLSVLRQDPTSAVAPQPDLTGLDDLAARVSGAGVPVSVHVEGPVADLPPALSLAAYRIVQESLTNVVKHAGAGAEARVTVTRTLDSLQLETVDSGGDPGTLPAIGGSGQGIAGMRERAALFGGTLEAVPLLAGGYRVFARLPLDPTVRKAPA